MASVTFADVSRGMLEAVEAKIARSGAPNVSALALDLGSTPSPRRFDLVATLMTLHHVPDVPGILRSFRGALDPGGVLCAADLDEEDGSFHGPGFEGHRGFRREVVAGWLEGAGFERIRFSTPFEVEREAAGIPRRYPVFLAVAERAGSGEPG